MKIRPVGAELFLADRYTYRQRDITKLIVSVRNFANGPKIGNTISLVFAKVVQWLYH
jgi:hypothetical protein